MKRRFSVFGFRFSVNEFGKSIQVGFNSTDNEKPKTKNQKRLFGALEWESKNTSDITF